MEAWMEKELEELRRQQNIYCPYCDDEQDIELVYKHTTYHGEYDHDEDKYAYCQNCGEKFIVKEIVIRSFETKKLEEEE